MFQIKFTVKNLAEVSEVYEILQDTGLSPQDGKDANIIWVYDVERSYLREVLESVEDLFIEEGIIVSVEVSEQ